MRRPMALLILIFLMLSPCVRAQDLTTSPTGPISNDSVSETASSKTKAP